MFSECYISFERFFLEGSINEDYLEKQKKKGFKIWVHSGPVLSFLAKFLHFSTKKLGIFLGKKNSSVNSTNFSIFFFVKFRQNLDINFYLF